MELNETDTDADDESAVRSGAERKAAVQRSTWVSIVVNLVMSVIQVSAGVFAKSQGLVADGIHSLSDLVADIVVLLASHHSGKEADDDHHYGHQRFENAASLVLGMLLLLVGAGMIYGAISKLATPEAIAKVDRVALWLVGVALFAKEMLFRYMLSIAKRVKSSMLVANAWHARSDAASSFVVGLGIVGNLAGYPILDPVAALIVGLMILKMGWEFAWDALHDLMDRAADDDETDAIRTTLLGTPGIIGVHDLHTRKMGDMIIADVHIEVDASLSVLAGHDIAVEARRRVLARHRVLNLMTHIDPWQQPDLDHAPVMDQSRRRQ